MGLFFNNQFILNHIKYPHNTIFRKSALGLGIAQLEVALRKTWKVEV